MSITGAMNDSIMTGLINGVGAAMWDGWNNSYAGYKSTAYDADWDAIGVAGPVLNHGDKDHFGSTPRLNTMLVQVMTAQAVNPEACCRYVDWWYSDPGINTLNYGEEGM